MKTKEFKTRFDEVAFITSEPDEMQGRFLAADVLMRWTETFLDEGTGEMVEIERSQLLMAKGTLLDPDKMSSLCFHLQAGDVKNVKVTNVQRTGEYLTDGRLDCIWSITAAADFDKKKHKYILYAQNLEQAINIARDYLEQTLQGRFTFTSAKCFQSCVIVEDDGMAKAVEDAEGNVVTEKKGLSLEYYNLTTVVKNRRTSAMAYVWLVVASSVDDAKLRVCRHIDRMIQDMKDKAVKDGRSAEEVAEEWDGYELTVMSGTASSVDAVLPREFSEKYFKKDQTEKAVDRLLGV